MPKQNPAAPMPKPPKGFEAGDTYYEVVAKTSFYPKMKPMPRSKAKADKPPTMKPMEVKVVNMPKAMPSSRRG